MGLRLRRSASSGITFAPVASIAVRCSRTRAITATSRPSSRAARAMGKKCEAKNQSSVTMKASRLPASGGAAGRELSEAEAKSAGGGGFLLRRFYRARSREGTFRASRRSNPSRTRRRIGAVERGVAGDGARNASGLALDRKLRPAGAEGLARGRHARDLEAHLYRERHRLRALDAVRRAARQLRADHLQRPEPASRRNHPAPEDPRREVRARLCPRGRAPAVRGT